MEIQRLKQVDFLLRKLSRMIDNTEFLFTGDAASVFVRRNKSRKCVAHAWRAMELKLHNSFSSCAWRRFSSDGYSSK